MVCKYCGEEIADDAVFCNHCGKELDDKLRCPVCNEIVKYEDSIYCSNCGARLDGQNVCECGFVYKGNFCPKCGKANSSVKTKKPKSNVKSSETRSWQKALHVAAAAIGLFGAAMALLFVFFIGMEYEIDVDKNSSSYLSYLGVNVNELGSQKFNLYYFFKDAFEDLSTRLSLLEEYSGGYEAVNTIIVVLATVASAIAILLTVTFAIIAIVKTILYLIDRTRTSPLKYSLATAFAFFIGVILFSFCVSETASIEYAAQDVEIELATVLNGATIAGIVLCAISAGLAIMIKLAANYNVLFTKKRICSTVASLSKILLITIASVIVINGIAQITKIPNGNMNLLMTTKGSIFTFMPAIMELELMNAKNPIDANVTACWVCALVAAILTMLVLVFNVIAVLKNSSTLEGKSDKNALWLDITISAIMLCAMIMTIIATIQAGNIIVDFYKAMGNTTQRIKMSCGGIIASTILILLSMGASIFEKVFNTKNNANEAL